MKKSISFISFLFLAVMAFAQAPQQPTVVVKEGKVMLNVPTENGVQEFPTSSKDLASQYSTAEEQIKALSQRRAMLAEILAIDEQITSLSGQKNLIAELFKQAQAGEKSLAETPKEEKPANKSGG